MKNLPLSLLSAGALAWSLSGCVTASLAPAPVPGAAHTLEARTPVFVELPPLGDGGSSPALVEWAATLPVVGMREGEVLQALGRPGERLTPEIWIYWRYYSPEKAVETGGHDTLVVAFARGKVSGMKLVDGDVLRKHLAGRGHRMAVTQL